MAWLDSPRGGRVLDRAASAVRFSLFGKTGTARRRLWRQLHEGITTRTVAGRVQTELDAHLERLQALAHAPDLPRKGVDLRRLVVVPRRLLCAELYRRLDEAARRHPALAATGEGAQLRQWFVCQVVEDTEKAIARARPSPWRPLPAGTDWIAVGVNEQFDWYPPLNGPAWSGHYHVLELRPSRMTRAVKRAARDAIAELEGSLPALTRERRSEIINRAAPLLAHPAGA